MSFLRLVVRNVWARLARSGFIAIAVALGVGTVVTLGVVTHSLRETAAGILQTGNADFTVSQKGVDDVLNSTIDERELAAIRSYPEVSQAVGALITIQNLNADNPLFIEIGLPPEELAQFGVVVVDGQPFSGDATDQAMLGYRAAQNLGLQVGGRLKFGTDTYRVVGLFRTNNDIGNSAAMIPLKALQAVQRQPGTVTLVFVQTRPGTNVPALQAAISHDHPELTTVRTESDFGRADRNLAFITAADRGATLLALLIGAVIVANTLLLSLFERIREFGLLRAVGWSRRRVVALVLGEALVIALIGAAAGVGLSFAATEVLKHTSALRGLLHPAYTAGLFWRALYVAGAMTCLGALYPSMRAAFLPPLEALSHE